jgi:hypothetical protein
MVWRILLFIFLAYVLYKLIFELIVPVYKATRRIKKDFGEMQDRMNNFMKNQQDASQQQAEPKESSSEKSKSGDYIDFEEIK